MTVYVKQENDKQKLYSMNSEIDMKKIEGMEIKHVRFQDGLVMFTLKEKR
jgi:hypothetical protein